MVKARFATADVSAEVACLKRKVIGYRITNVYDITPKVYMFKLHKSGAGENEETDKQMLILESGTRFHLSKYTRDKSNTPSNFCLKLRKHIRSKRIEQVQQVGVDRIVDFTIGSGPARHHLILELYSQGNIILTDADYKVLTLLRSHRDDEKEFAIMANHPYPIDRHFTLSEVTAETLSQVQRSNPGSTLKNIVNQVIPYGQQVSEHCVRLCDIDPKLKLPGELSQEHEGLLTQIASQINKVGSFLRFSGEELPKGYIVLSEGKGAPDSEEEPKVYVGFEPFLTKQSEAKPCQTYETFNDAVDEFYSSIECQREEVVKHQEKKQISTKLDKIKLDLATRTEGLRSQALSTNKKAQLIEYNLDSVDAAINAVNEALASGFDWKELDQMIKSEQKAGNPVAKLVHALHLERNAITLKIRNDLDESEEGEENQFHKVPVDLGMTAHANARALYQQRKKHEQKESRTIEASEKVLKDAEKKANAQLKKLKLTSAAGFKIARKQFWFEKFDWFITSENYLVVSGRDAQQNEIIVKRYLTKHDVYVHADIHGAASCIIRNRSNGGAIPPSTLEQAGTFCVSHSQAWNSKFTTGSWWVYSNQVSKTAPTGEYLTTGSFMIRGKKNFLQPTQLLMGYTMVFKLDDDFVSAHLGERSSKYVESEAAAGDHPEEASADSDTEAIMEIEEVDESDGSQKSEGEEDDDDDIFASLDTPLNVSAKDSSAQSDSSFEIVGETKKERHYPREHLDAKRAEEMQKQEVAKAKKHVRGKHGKKKKMKKYADQDDEDRALAMMLLHGQGQEQGQGQGRGPSSPSPQQEVVQEEKEAKQDDTKAEVKSVEAKEDDKAADKQVTEEPSEAPESADKKDDKKDEEHHDGDVNILNSLTGVPREEDVVHFALPMVAPWSSLSARSYKYRIKLQPGNLKKGKAAKAALDMLLRMYQPPQRDYQLVKSIPENELVATMIGNSKPSVPGGGKDKDRKVIKNKRKGKGKGRGKKKR